MHWFSLCFCCLFGVFGVSYEMKPHSVAEGDSLTLHTDREMRNNDLIWWRFGPGNTLIAEVSVSDGSVTVRDDYDERFRGRMKVDHQTGCLTITNTRSEHAGRYELHTNRMNKSFVVVVNVFGDKEELKSVSAMEGNSVTLRSELRSNDPIQWRFGNSLISETRTDGIAVNDEVLDGRFRGRLKVDEKTGSLTITDTTTDHTGFYQLQMNQTKKVFILTVYAPLPAPVIFGHCPLSPGSRRVLVCAVLNVSHMTLSWLQGERLLSSVSTSELSLSLSLPLEVDGQDSNSYSCVLNNSFADRTQHLDFAQLCQTGSACGRGCNAVEAVIRLALSALVGVAAAAAVVVLVYDIRSRRAEHSQVPTSAT